MNARLVFGSALWGMLIMTSSLAGNLYPDDKEALENSRGLGDLIFAAKSPVHVVFVHGMRANGPDTSRGFRTQLAKFLGRLDGNAPSVTHESRQRIEVGPIPDAEVFGSRIWRSEQEWEASRPFVDRYRFVSGSRVVVVDEVNWWPLLFPVKCRFLVVPETLLSGVDREHLKLCASTDAPFYPWLSQSELQSALSQKQRAGGGAKFNASIKQQIFNWGLSDAVIVSGPLKSYFRKALNGAFEFAQTSEGEFVVISESLGSFVVLDAFQNQEGDASAAEQLSTRVSRLYFFANQFRLLELGRISGLPEGARALIDLETTPSDLLRGWAQTRSRSLLRDGELDVKQLITFSDPSDMLTYDVPPILDEAGNPIAVVINVHTKNAVRWFGLIADPVKAHTGFGENKAVMDEVFRIHRN